MKKLNLNVANLGATEILSREELRKVLGGSGTGTGTGTGSSCTAKCTHPGHSSTEEVSCTGVKCSVNMNLGQCTGVTCDGVTTNLNY